MSQEKPTGASPVEIASMKDPLPTTDGGAAEAAARPPEARDPDPDSASRRPPLLRRSSAEAAEDRAAEELRELRRFHLSGPFKDSAAPADLLPALLHPLREPSRVRTDYPLFLHPVPETADPDSQPAVEPLAAFLEATLERMGPGADGARILKDNLLRLERAIRRKLADDAGPRDADDVVRQSADELRRELNLRGENAERLKQDLDAFVAAVPSGGRLLGFDRTAAVHLLLDTARRRLRVRRAAFRREVRELAHRLQSLLDVEAAKDPARRDAKALQESLGSGADAFVDAGALSKVLGPHRGSVRMPGERRRRIEHIREILTEYSRDTAEPCLILVHDGSFPVERLKGTPGWTAETEENPCAGALIQFQRQATRFTELFRAVRVARLELDGAYDPKRHEPWLLEFDWEAFSRRELLLLPAIAALDAADRLAGKGMISLSQLLRSGKPVQVVVSMSPAENPAALGRDPLEGYRLELGFLGIGHREALVQQSSTARPEHLLAGFRAGLDATTASLHIVASGLDTGGRVPRLGAWLHAGAGLEGRAHPFFRYNPEAGSTWASRLDFSGNPAAAEDWPIYPLECRTDDEGAETLNLAFTFADYALLEPVYQSHFRTVRPGAGDDDMIPVPEYLELSPEEAAHKLPYIWAVNPEGRMVRLVVTRRLALACRDRLDYWRTLEELAGVRNEYVREATERARDAALEEARAEKEALEARHAEELQRVRDEAAGEAFQGLARMLLDLDAGTLADLPPAAPRETPAGRDSSGAAGSPAAPASATAAEETSAAAAPAEAADEEEEISFDEPWITTPLCTSCNDCINLNPRLFVYDENKQARIGDPRAGTYAQLVQAAEKCPAHCIHPGKPLNPDEPNLEELIKRAERFNR
ncbi:MAG: ferredoxin [Candidatus Eisenbacteria bacterium]|nr:ferredoxin [Candidatus Eisenbacteria bacterium]